MENKSIEEPDSAMPEDWTATTPAVLEAAVKYIRDEFDRCTFRIHEDTRKGCFELLHNSAALAAANDAHIDNFKEPSIFGLGFHEYRTGVQNCAVDAFKGLMAVALANAPILDFGPVEWARKQTLILIEEEAFQVARWIKESCDVHDHNPSEYLNERVEWNLWRAPKFLHMQPCGNTVYESSSAWNREDEVNTQQALKYHREYRFILPLKSALERTAGEEHVRLASKPRQLNDSVVSSDKMADRRNGPGIAGVPPAISEATVLDKLKDPTAHPSLTREEVEAVLHLSKSSVYRLADEGHITKRSNGRFTTDSVKAYIDSPN